MNIKKAITKLANRFGYDIRRLVHETDAGRLRTTIAESYSLLHELGFRPKIVVDIGVATGTKELYTAFPESFFLLIEPLREFESDLKQILKEYKGSYVLAAAGSSAGQMTFNVHKDHLDGSSLYKETMGAVADGYEIAVPTIRIDDILRAKELKGPYLIKIDVQGAELEALEGAQKTLLESEVVVLEVSMFEFMKGAPQFFDVVLYMKNHGFVAYDIIHGWNRPLDNALGQIDIVFVKEDGRFRQDHSYSTLE
jgi:FkbM family methyltransferase